MRELRRIAVLLVITSFTAAALLGVVTLLAGTGFGETQARILLTTTVVGIESVAMLCYLALAGHRLVAVGVAGALASYVATALGLVLTWSESALDSGDLFRWWGVAVTLSATLAQASLLIALARRRPLHLLLAATLSVAGLLAALVCWVIAGGDAGVGLAKTIGVLAILDVLGTLVLAALSAFGGLAGVSRVSRGEGGSSTA
jgi:hypothetical protein